jgi:hypothetical protein
VDIELVEDSGGMHDSILSAVTELVRGWNCTNGH